MDWIGMAGKAGFGKECRGSLGQARFVKDMRGSAGRVFAWIGAAGGSWIGVEGLGRKGMFRSGLVGKVGFGWAGKSCRG